MFHIRAKRMDLCFELATQIMAQLGDAVSAVDEVHGFRYFDDRDLLGFVDGTENPSGRARLPTRCSIGDEDPAFAGGSYVIVQKYLHDLDGWNALSTEAQEHIIGRKKLSDIELDDSVKPTSAHNALTTIVENGKQIKILRDNMPFGTAGAGRVWHLLHRLQPLAPNHRADAGEHVHRQAAGKLRPPARLQPRGHGKPVLRPDGDVPRCTRPRRAADAAPPRRRRRQPNPLHPHRRSPMVRSASVPLKEKFRLNNLHRELAPISDAAWAQIEEEASRTIKRYLAGAPRGRCAGSGGPGPFRRGHRPFEADRPARRKASSPASAK